ncbi:MAG: dihydrodipicolinate synthase family protein [Chloroflexi bacterium]|nr:dihydrodipicolinate synthase family protein [Chloroflexota bacterium]
MSAPEPISALSGVIPVLSMPVREDQTIDLDALARQADHLIGVGVDALSFGFGSELPRLTDRERDESLRIVADTTARRVPVMASVVTESIGAARARCEDAAAAGADLVMVTPPHADGAGIRRFLDDLAERSPLPLVLQDAPAAIGVTLSVDLLREVGRHPRVVALKIETPDAVTRIARLADDLAGAAALLGGSGGLELLAELRAGSVGTMPGAGHAAVFVAILDAHHAGDAARAEWLFGLLQPVLVLASRSGDTFLAIQKELLRRAGVLGDARLRQPSEPMSDRVRAELDLLQGLLDERLAAGPDGVPSVVGA